MSTVIGIDVGGPNKGFHAVALANNTLSAKLSTSDPKLLAKWCRDLEATTIAVDAPCIWSIDGRAREAERLLMRQKIWCFSTPTRAAALSHPKKQFTWMLAGEGVFNELSESHRLYTGGPRTEAPAVIETFPHAAVCALRGSVISAKKKAGVRRKLLVDEGLNPVCLPNIDFVDAALCALVARYFQDDRYSAIGRPEDGYIVVPRR